MISRHLVYDVAVFGGSGFIGKALTSALEKKGKRVLSIARENTWESASHLTQLDIDLGRWETLANQAWSARSYFILVGQVHKAFDVSREKEILYNILRFINTRPGEAKVFYASTALVYGTCERPMDEEATPRPVEVYSKFKKEAEDMVQKELTTHTVAILRFGNVYGQGESRGFVKLVLDRAKDLHLNLLSLNGVGDQKRDYIYLADLVDASLVLEERMKESDTVNIASGTSRTLLEVIATIERVTGKKIPFTLTHTSPQEAHSSLISIKKLSEKYGFVPAYSLEAGIKALWRTV